MNKIWRKPVRFISAGILVIAAGPVMAGWFGADFSAEIYEGNSQGMTRQGSMAVSQGRVRTEINRNGQSMVEIINPAKGKAWLLNPQSKQYLERVVPGESDQQRSQETPCVALPPQASCSLVGREVVNGRNSDRWQLQADGKTQLIWLDAEHHFPVRVVNGGNLVMEMRYLGREKLGQRIVEKWQSQMAGTQGSVTALQWYDPQLNIAIRQVMPDGRQRELKNIRIGPQQDALFAVPNGYQLQIPQNQ